MSAFDGTDHPSDRMPEYQRVASEGGLSLKRKARRLEALSAVLAPAEVVLALSAGTAEGNLRENLLAVTDHRILILKDDPGEAVSLDLGRVVKITAKRGFGSGQIDILLQDKRVKITVAHNDSIVLFAQRAEEARQSQQEAVANTSSSPQTEGSLQPAEHVSGPATTARSGREEPPTSLSPHGSVVGELEKLASLMERSLITPEEFAEQKAKLLGSGGESSAGQKQSMPREAHKDPQAEPTRRAGGNARASEADGASGGGPAQVTAARGSDTPPAAKKEGGNQAALGCLTGIALLGAIIWGVSTQCSSGEDDCAWLDRVARGTGVDVVCVDE